MSDDISDFWDIVAKPANLDELKVGDIVGLEEHHEGKPYRRSVIRITSNEPRDTDGRYVITFDRLPFHDEFPDVVIITPNRMEDARYQ